MLSHAHHDINREIIICCCQWPPVTMRIRSHASWPVHLHGVCYYYYYDLNAQCMIAAKQSNEFCYFYDFWRWHSYLLLGCISLMKTIHLGCVRRVMCDAPNVNIIPSECATTFIAESAMRMTLSADGRALRVCESRMEIEQSLPRALQAYQQAARCVQRTVQINNLPKREWGAVIRVDVFKSAPHPIAPVALSCDEFCDLLTVRNSKLGSKISSTAGPCQCLAIEPIAFELQLMNAETHARSRSRFDAFLIFADAIISSTCAPSLRVSNSIIINKMWSAHFSTERRNKFCETYPLSSPFVPIVVCSMLVIIYLVSSEINVNWSWVVVRARARHKRFNFARTALTLT